MAEWVRSLYFSALKSAVSGVGSSTALATCETSHVLLADVSGGLPGVLSFRPTYRLARLYMSEIVERTGIDPRPGRCVVSLSKRHLLPKSTGNTQE